MKHHRILAGVIGVTMIAFGLNQVMKPKKWEKYMPSLVDSLLPVRKDTAMKAHGGSNILLGMALLVNVKPVVVRGTAGLWWAWVALFCGRFDWRIAVRDFMVAVTLLSVAKEDKR